MVEKAKVFVENYMSGDSSGHDYFHTLRVLRVAETIALEESKRKCVDMEAVQLMALLHDIDDRKLSPETHKNLDRARGFLLESGVGEERISMILSGIRQISFKGTDSVNPDTIEACCVQDADRLDAIGAIGIARAFAYGGSRGRELYIPTQPPKLHMDAETYANAQSHTINHFYEKLLLLKDMMNTETGKMMAAHRHEYMEAFLKEFYGEWDGDR